MTDWAAEVYSANKLTPERQKEANLDWAEVVYAPATTGVSDATATGRMKEPTVVAPGRPAGFMAGFKGNIVSDPQTRIKQYATALFPNEPNAERRFGILDDRVVYRGDDGTLYDAETGPGATIGRLAASAPEALGGIAGSFAASPVLGGTLGASGGRALKNIAGNLALDEPQTTGGVASGIAVEGAVNALGGGLAKLGGGLLNRSAMSGAERVDRQALAGKIADTKARTGITLDFSQAADIPELRMWKRFAAEYPNEASEMVAKFDQGQVAEIEQAFVNNLLPKLTAQSDNAFNANRAVTAAKGLIEAAKAKRAETVKPLYDAAFDEFERKGFVKGQVVAEFKKDPVLAMAIASVQKDPVLRRELMNYKGNNLALLDLAKRKIDDMIGAAKASGENHRASLLAGAKQKLTSRLDALSPSYAQARGEFERLTRETVDPLTKGAIGVLSKVEGEGQVEVVSRFIQELPKQPALVGALRDKFAKQDPEAWDAMVRLSIERTLDKALRDNTTGQVSAAQVAGRLRQQLYGTPQQRAAMKAALGANAGAVDELFDTLALIAKDFRPNSATVPKALVAEEAGRAGMVQSAAAKVATGINPLDWGRALREWGTMVRTGEAASAIAQALTDPEKVVSLRQLRRVSDPQQRVMQMLGVLGAQTSLAAAADAPETLPQQ